MNRLLVAPVTLLLLAALASPAAAHGEAEALVVVPREQLTQGEPFPVYVVDLAPGEAARLLLARGQDVLQLGTAQADQQGHFEATLTVPEGYPDGYSELVAQSEDGTRASTWVLIGAAGEPAAGANDGIEWWRVGGLLVGVVLVVGSGLLLARRLRARRA